MVIKKNILVTGSGGQLGHSLKNISHIFSNYNFYFKKRSQLDITNFNFLNNYIIEKKINIIINCAAYTNVERAETESNIADLTNHIAVDNISKICSDNKIQLIHISTDYVFDGLKNSPYDEDDLPNPIGYYGKSKLAGEKKMMSYNLQKSVIIRTSWLYSNYGENFLNKILNRINLLFPFSVVDDQYGSPTSANDLANLIMEIIPKLDNKTEIYHFSNLGSCSRYDFANKINEQLPKDVIIKPKATSNNDKIRPKYSALDSKKIINKFEIKINHWSTSLKQTLKKNHNT